MAVGNAHDVRLAFMKYTFAIRNITRVVNVDVHLLTNFFFASAISTVNSELDIHLKPTQNSVLKPAFTTNFDGKMTLSKHTASTYVNHDSAVLIAHFNKTISVPTMSRFTCLGHLF